MTPTMQDLGIDRLSAEQRLQLLGEIWASLSPCSDPIPESHREELDRRLAAADADPAAGRPWEEVRARSTMKKARFKLSISVDEETGKLIAVYLRVREGAAEETVGLEEDAAYADYDAEGQLLGVELLAPCAVEVMDKLTLSEPAEVCEFLHASPRSSRPA